MSQMFFGQYLLEEGVIDADRLGEALEHAERVNARIGTLAVEHGFMREAELEQVQLEQRHADARFADLAVGLGLLEPKQASQLLAEQKIRHKPLGVALVELGHLAADELDDWLDRFHMTQLDLDAAHLELPFELCEDDLAVYLVEYFPRLFRRLTQVPVKLEAGRPFHGRSNLPYRLRFECSGAVQLQVGVACCEEMASQLAAAFAGAPVERFGAFELASAVSQFGELLADAGKRSVLCDGLLLEVSAIETDALPKSGFWFPAATPCGRGVLVLDSPS